MNELELGEAVSTLPFPSITGEKDTSEVLACPRTGVLLIGTSFNSGTGLTWVVPWFWKGGETREGDATVGTGAPKMYARSRFVSVTFGKVGEGCRT